ncbi:MAG: NUDIX domain-containing protein [Candidatus Obscuribacterales bacterium]|jgi:8-oxo-dGTP diphosphatase
MTNLQVTVDIVLFTIVDRQLHVLLIRRLAEPFRGSYALPGGFVLENESVDDAAHRELQEETGVEKVFLEQLYTFGEPKRDPRGRVITVAYYALVANSHILRSGTDAADATWFSLDKLPTLAFDHKAIIEYAHQRIRGKLDYSNVGFELLPEKFTLTELQLVHEAILGESLDKRNFRRKILQQEIVEATQEWQKTGRKPAQLYRFAVD